MSSRRKANPTRLTESELGDTVKHKSSTSLHNTTRMSGNHLLEQSKASQILITYEDMDSPPNPAATPPGTPIKSNASSISEHTSSMKEA
ncbi:hypothetical protein KIN20_037429 [Parelaphostrongylus tenuis]|uniref:Uncharacterized protein n=1 Tax=Parelaphostrongylus tenuis TaxID=148309 RepID=A0AAD5RHY8_PARTN|nr:hypothetical protein KIN20_037429 [Parelaphostrongylus tenuis]